MNYGMPIREFWRAYELKLYEDQIKIVEPELLRIYKEISPEASAKFATDYTIAVADRAFRAAEKIHDALVLHMAAAPNTPFKIPAELLEPTINETALRIPTDGDSKALAEAKPGHSLLTRDEGNIKINSVSASDAPNVDGYKFNLPGASVNITLKQEQTLAKQEAAKLLYEVELDNELIKAYGGLEKLKKNLAFVMSINGKALKVVGPDTDVLTSFQNALDKGIATLTLTSTGAIVGLEYILADEVGVAGVYNDRLVVFDGNIDGVIKGSIWLATPDIVSFKDKIKEETGCDAGFGFAALGFFAILAFVIKRSK
jgi:hypothetical protein